MDAASAIPPALAPLGAAASTPAAPELDEARDDGHEVTIYIHQKPQTFKPVTTNAEFIDLYATLTETQKRVVRLRKPHESNRASCERAGISVDTLSAWLWGALQNPRFSENFRRIWYSIRYPDDTLEAMTYVANLLGERNLWRLEGIAKQAEQWPTLEKVDKVEARKAVERLATLPFERHDKAREQAVSGIVEAWLRLLAQERARVIEGKVVDTEVAS